MSKIHDNHRWFIIGFAVLGAIGHANCSISNILYGSVHNPRSIFNRHGKHFGKSLEEPKKIFNVVKGTIDQLTLDMPQIICTDVHTGKEVRHLFPNSWQEYKSFQISGVQQQQPETSKNYPPPGNQQPEQNPGFVLLGTPVSPSPDMQPASTTTEDPILNSINFDWEKYVNVDNDKPSSTPTNPVTSQSFDGQGILQPRIANKQ